MNPTACMTDVDVTRLRCENYNSAVLKIDLPSDDLMVMRVRPDRGIPPFTAGQHAVLGLGAWEPRTEGTQFEPAEMYDADSLIKRAYSISCPLLDDNGRLLRTADCDFLEFFITLVRFAHDQPPALTPRIFALRQGDGIYCGPRLTGHYTLGSIGRDENVVFAATGVGEAPHNAMIADLLSYKHRGRIVAVTCVRKQRDLAYLNAHRELERQFANYRYLKLTTREPVNLDPSTPGFVGKRYLQEYFASGDFERDADIELSPADTHVFLCGQPDMIGPPRRTHDPRLRYPQPTGMVEILERRGFRVEQPHDPGNVHFERYW